MPNHTPLPTAINNGRVIDPANGIDRITSVFLADGRIAAVGDQAPDGFAAAQNIDATGCIVCPGLIDLAVHLPNVERELGAAAAGGVTRVVCPPDTSPPLDEAGLVERLVRRAGEAGGTRVHPLGALTSGLAGTTLAEMATLAAAGCIAFSQGKRPIDDTLVMMRALQYAASLGFAVWLQPEDYHLAQGGAAHDGAVAAQLGLPGIPICAETIAIATALELVRESGARVHFRRLSSAAGIRLLAAGRAEGLPVTGDVSIYHLHLTDEAIGVFDSNARLSPPLRTARDRDALRAAIADGALQAIVSDHTPVSDDGKQLPFAEAEVGASGVELLLPLAVALAETGGVPLARCLAAITCEPAALADLPGGTLSVGAAADVCVFDPADCWEVTPAALHSSGSNTPLAGQKLTGRVRLTIIDGRLVFSRG
ncbi:MAG TPA: dihydroorotase [Rhodocyclaceae bacterium]